ncbi:MAG: hypothetical protein ABF709_05065 [Leuconostoc pseudomesenteroides]|uniref:hypothetical protein n=1 Tax=Leuconostoc pseudomesenteroides TaxID=33968 RepID=UPI001E451BD4|nr:hypothetical protein [Leuconostoc pseudomesenteroides]MCC7668910.1 hypothetical protein [Leuconostoc pseudomesenteroides]
MTLFDDVIKRVIDETDLIEVSEGHYAYTTKISPVLVIELIQKIREEYEVMAMTKVLKGILAEKRRSDEAAKNGKLEVKDKGDCLVLTPAKPLEQ